MDCVDLDNLCLPAGSNQSIEHEERRNGRFQYSNEGTHRGSSERDDERYYNEGGGGITGTITDAITGGNRTGGGITDAISGATRNGAVRTGGIATGIAGGIGSAITGAGRNGSTRMGDARHGITDAITGGTRSGDVESGNGGMLSGIGNGIGSGIGGIGAGTAAAGAGVLGGAAAMLGVNAGRNGSGGFNSKGTRGNEDSATSDETYGAGVDNIQADVVMISGCQDNQTSADVGNVSSFSLPDPNGRSGGACTSALLQVLYNNKVVTDLTFVSLLKKMRFILRNGRYSQIPQLTSSKPLDIDDNFYIVPPTTTGTKRAVLIGINYVGQQGQLSGCHNDCLNMKDYIKDVWGFQEENIVVLMDDGSHTNPTRNNILKAYQRVAFQSRSGDAVFCHYSGHGARIRDDDYGEEEDGYDETLVPVDYTSAGQIRDDALCSNLVCAMPAGSSLVALMDCCHSATVLDLPYKYTADGSSTPYGNTSYGSGLHMGNSLCCCLCALILALVVVLPLMFKN